MGIYVFDMDVLVKALQADAAEPASHHDFGKNIMPLLIGHGRVFAYPFHDENKKAAKYWRDVGTLDAYYEANMDLCHVNPEFNLYDRSGRSAPTSRSRRRPSSSSPTTGAWARRSTR